MAEFLADLEDILRSSVADGRSLSGMPEHLSHQLPRYQLEEPTREATAMDTMGSLIDKLVTVNLKMWHNQETLYAIRRMDEAGFEEAWGGKLDELHAVIKRCCDLNVQRSRLIDEIDVRLRQAVAGEVAAEDLVRGQHKTY